MSRIRSKNTKPELIIRKALSKLKIKYRIHYPIVGKPDIVFPAKKVAVFIHGCFWHGHGCRQDHTPRTNKKFWSTKIVNNKTRDTKIVKTLHSESWKVIILWECEILIDTEKSINKILENL